MAHSKHILLIEDNPADAVLIQLMFDELTAETITLTHVDTLSKAIYALDTEEIVPDIILTDLNLPDSMGIDTVRRIAALDLKAPTIVLSGRQDKGLALESLRNGAQEYLLKDTIHAGVLERVIEFALERQQLKLTLKDYARQLEENERRFRLIYDTNSDGMLIVDEFGELVMSNPAAKRILPVEDTSKLKTHFLDGPAHEKRTTEIELTNKSGVLETFELAYEMFTWDQSKYYLLVLHNVTHRKHEEKIRRQSEALKRVQQLAGALCHEFAQPLQILSSCLELLENKYDHSEEMKISRRMVKRIIGLVGRIKQIDRLETQDYLDTQILDLNACSDNEQKAGSVPPPL